jgi:hypothetical protein
MSSRASLYSLGSLSARTRFAAVIFVGTVLAIGVAGCRPENPVSSKNSGAKANAKADPAAAADARCQQLLSSALDMMKPENLGITSREQQVVDSLNNWAGDCGKASADKDPPAKEGTAKASTAKEGPGKEGTAKEGAGKETPNEFADLYDLGDVLHVRDCWLTRQLGSGVMQAQPTDLDRVVGLFELACRTVALQSAEEPAIAQRPYDIMVTGLGTTEDRAWIFGELLRQAGIDAVIVSPKAGGAAARWLVGAILDKDIYLFDPTLGWPIPSLEDKGTTALVKKPATLAQASAHDELLRKLDVSEKKYPLRALDLKSVKAEVITSRRYGEPRIKRLESFLAGNRSVVAYAPAKDIGDRPGLLARVAAAGNGSWKKEDVSVWPYPDRQIEGAKHLDERAQKAHDARWLPFEGPVELDFDETARDAAGNLAPRWVVSTGVKIVKEDKGRKRGPSPDGDVSGRDEGSTEVRFDPKKEIKSRIAQLQGDFGTAIRKYLLVQLEELDPQKALPEKYQKQLQDLPPEKRPQVPGGVLTWPVGEREFLINFYGAENAKFWMGLCQMEQNERESAEETFSAYLRSPKYASGNGRWIVEAASLRAQVLAESNKFALAVQAMDQLVTALPANDYRRPTYELLETRWRTIRDGSKPVASSTAETPASTETPKAAASPAPPKPADAAAKKEAPPAAAKTTSPPSEKR